MEGQLRAAPAGLQKEYIKYLKYLRSLRVKGGTLLVGP